MEATQIRQENQEESGRSEPELEREEREEEHGEEREEPRGEGEQEREEPRGDGEQGEEPRGEGEQGEEPRGEGEQGEEEREERGEEGEEERSGPPVGKVAGGVAIFFVLALYFVWIGNEMGSHAVSGSFEMWAIFGAIFIGVVAMIAGGASMRRH